MLITPTQKASFELSDGVMVEATFYGCNNGDGDQILFESCEVWFGEEKIWDKLPDDGLREPIENECWSLIDWSELVEEEEEFNDERGWR